MMIIYDPANAVLIETEVSDRSGLYKGGGGKEELTLLFHLDRHIDIPIGSWCNFEGARYEVLSTPEVKMINTECYSYSVVLSSKSALLSLSKVRNKVDGRLKFDMVAKAQEHLDLIVDNLNRRDSGWSAVSNVDTVEKLISYNHTGCDEALVAIAEAFETEFEVIGKEIILGKVEYYSEDPLALSYGKGKGFRSGIVRIGNNGGLPTEKVFIQGGSRNISLKDYGSAELHLPKQFSFGFDGEYFNGESGYDSSKAKQFETDEYGSYVKLEGALFGKEDSLDLSEVYPSREGKVTGVVFIYKGQEYTQPLTSWTEEEWNEVQIDILDDTIPGSLDYNRCLIENGDPLTVIFQSGMLAGREFDATYVSDKKRFELKKHEIDGLPMPQGVYIPAVDDTYAVFNVYLPEEYVSDESTYSGAEFDALREASRFLYESSDVKFSFSGEIDGIWSKKNWEKISPRIRIGSCISFVHEKMFPEPVLARIVGITQYVNNPYSPKIEISNSIGFSSLSSRINVIENKEAHFEELNDESIRYTKRRFSDVRQTIQMLSQAFDNFSDGINPVTVETMLAAVGDESLQYVFTKSMDSDDPDIFSYSYDINTKIFSAGASCIKHMTLGIESISPVHSDSEYKRWSISAYSSKVLEPGKGYYLYAVVPIESGAGEFDLKESPVKIDSVKGYYHLLVGILNKESNGDRSFASLYGFTEILPGQIVTESIRSSDGKTWLDLLRGILHLNDMAGVSGVKTDSKGDQSIAAWFGGLMKDRELDEDVEDAAKSVIRHDGTGYFADGLFKWDKDKGINLGDGQININYDGSIDFGGDIRIGNTGEETLDSLLTIVAGLAEMWKIDDDGNLVTTRQVVVKNSLVVENDMSTGGEGNVTSVGITGVLIDSKEYKDVNSEGLLDLTEAFKNSGVSVDLSNYYTREEVDKKIADLETGTVDLSNYYTKTEVYNKEETYSKDEVNELVKGGESDMFAWADEAKTTIKTEKNLIVEGGLSDSGVAGNVTVGVTGIVINGEPYLDTDRDGIIDLTDALKAFDFNLEDYATKAEVSVISTKVNSLVSWKEDFLKYIYIGDDLLVHVTTDIIIGGDIATAADGEGGGSYASIGIIVGNSLAEYPNTAGIVTLSKELITSGIGLGELAFTDNVSWDDVVGRPTSLSQFTDDVVSGKYLPLSGGVMNDTLTINASPAIKIYRPIGGTPYIRFGRSEAQEFGELGVDVLNGNPIWWGLVEGGNAYGSWHPITHSGNIGDYALKYQGISLPDNVKSGFGYNSEPNGYPHTGGFATFGNGVYGFQIMGYSPYARLSARGLNNGSFTDWKTIAFTDSTVDKAKSVVDANGNALTLLHSENVGDYALKTDGSNKMGASAYINWDTVQGNEDYSAYNDGIRLLGYNPTTGNYSGGIHVGTYYGWQIVRDGYIQAMRVRYYNRPTSSWSSWKNIAFTDSDITGNAATATKLQTARTIWGQSFDGTGNIANSELILYKNPSGYTGGWARDLRALDSAGNILGQYGFFGMGDALNYMYMGKAYNNPWIVINSLGNVTIGSGDLAGDDHKLYTVGHSGFVGNIDIYSGGKIQTYSNPLIINDAGNNVLIGTTTNNSSGKLQVEGGVTLKGYVGANTISKVSDLGERGLVVSVDSGRNNWGMAMWTEGNGNGYIQQQAFGSTTAYALCLNPFGGRVGIGTTTPQYKLDVAGTGRFSEKLHANGGINSIGGSTYGYGFSSDPNNYGMTQEMTSSAALVQIAGYAGIRLKTAPNNAVYPSSSNIYLGRADYRWLNIYGANGDFSALVSLNGGATIPTGNTLLLGSESLGATLQYITDVGVKIDGNLVVTGDLSDAGVADSGGGVGGYFDIAIYPQYASGDIYLAEIVLNGSDAYYLYMPSVTEYIGYTPFDEAEFTRDNIKSRLGISDWALAASKPSYTTNDVSEGTNLYFTNARAKSAIFTGSSSQFLKADGTLDSTTYLGLDADGDLSIPGIVYANGITLAQDVYLEYLNDTIKIYNRNAGIYLYAGDMITLDGGGVDIYSMDDMSIYSEGDLNIGCDFNISVHAYEELSMHSEGKASITSDMAITITGANFSVGTEDRSASFLLQDGLMDVYCDLAIQGSLELQHTGNYIGTGASHSMLFHSENNPIIFEVGEDQMVSITEDGLYINDYKFDVTTAVTSGSSSLVTSGAVYSKLNSYLPKSGGTMTGDLILGDGDLILGKGARLFVTDYSTTNGETRLALQMNNAGNFLIGQHTAKAGYDTNIYGNGIFFRYYIGESSYIAMSVKTDGDVEMNNNLIVKGDQATGSDIRFKNVIESKVLDIRDMAEAPLFTFKWNNRDDEKVYLGSSAQYWEGVAPWLVSGEDFKTLNYATLGVAMGISLAKKTVNHEERIKELERKVESLETENRRLRYGN